MNDSNETYENQDLVKASSIDNEEAKQMINDTKTKKNKFKYENLIWSYFSKDRMLKICNEPNVAELKFFVGVFPDSAGPRKKDAPTIVLQVKKTTESLITEFEYHLGDDYCPPPNDTSCGTLETR